MEDVLYDYHIAKAMGEEVRYDEHYRQVLYIESVFRKHGITQADFDSSMVWFSRHPEVLSKIYEKVNARLKTERDGINHLIALRDNKPKESLPGDSIDVWAWQPVYRLKGMPLNNKMVFVLPADSNFHDRDTLRWNVRFCFHDNSEQNDAPMDSVYAPLMAMQVLYEKNDTIVGSVRKVMGEGVETISLHADTLGKIKEVRGFIYYPEQRTLRSVLADRISLMRYHAKDSLMTSLKDSLLHTPDSVRRDTTLERRSVEPKPSENRGVNADEKSRHKSGRPRPTPGRG